MKKVIKSGKKVFGMDVRLIEKDFPKGKGYEVQYDDKGVWSTVDYGPGSLGWAFVEKKQAEEFFDDMSNLSQKKMCDKYCKKGRWID